MYARKLNKTTSHRLSMLKTMVTQLFEKGSIQTTFPKAKELSVFANKLITKMKKDNLHNRRQVLPMFRNETLVKKLFEEVVPSKKKDGGHVRVLKLGIRKGDAAQMALIEII